jgi:hypothetical protein
MTSTTAEVATPTLARREPLVRLLTDLSEPTARQGVLIASIAWTRIFTSAIACRHRASVTMTRRPIRPAAVGGLAVTRTPITCARAAVRQSASMIV